MARKCLLSLMMVALTECVFSPPIYAQSPGAANVGLSYSFLRLLDDADENMPTGWLVSFAQPVRGTTLSIVGEAAGNYERDFGETLRLHTFQGGIRLGALASRNVTAFGQFLAGVMNIGCCGVSENYFAIEPGGGVDLQISHRASLRLGASFPIAFNDGEQGHAARLHAGVVLPIGGR